MSKQLIVEALLVAAGALVVVLFLSLVVVAHYRGGRDLTCPGCGRHSVRRSYPAGVLDSILITLSCPPYRCIACNRRFYRRDRSGSESERELPET